VSRVEVIGPIAFTLIGASAGICLAMLFRQEPSERAHVHLDDSFPFFLAGCGVGLVCGCAVAGVCTWRPRLVPLVSIASTTLLGAAIAAPIGWIVGDEGDDRLPRKGMAVGALVGASIGSALGIAQWRLDRRRYSREEQQSPASEPQDVR
jgi:drug/metabolite transporter (DMT)-like permease